MGKRVARVLMGVVVASAMLAASPVRVEAQLSTQPFAAYGNATAVALNALAARHDAGRQHPGGQLRRASSTPPASAARSTTSSARPSTRRSRRRQERLRPGQRRRARSASRRPSQPANLNQLILTQVAEANAPPPSDLITEEIPTSTCPGSLTASTARGQAQATYDPEFCPVGPPAHLRPRLRREPAGPARAASAASSAPAPPATRSPRPARSPTWSPTVTAPTACVAESQAIVAPVSVAGTGITIDIAGPDRLPRHRHRQARRPPQRRRPTPAPR